MAKNIVPSLRLGWYHSVNSTRNYSKWFHRRPVKVILPEDSEKKGSRRAKLKVERQISFVENVEKPDPFLLDEIIKEHGDPRPEFEKNTDIAFKQSEGNGTSGNRSELDPQDKMFHHKATENSETVENPVFVAAERIMRAKMRQNIERSINPSESQMSASIKREKRVSMNDSLCDSVSSGEEKVCIESETAQISDPDINKTHFLHGVDVNSRTRNFMKSNTDGKIKRSKRRQIIERPKTFQSKIDSDDDIKERFSDDSDHDSVSSSDEEAEREETGEGLLFDKHSGEPVTESLETSGKLIKFTKLPDSDTKLR